MTKTKAVRKVDRFETKAVWTRIISIDSANESRIWVTTSDGQFAIVPTTSKPPFGIAIGDWLLIVANRVHAVYSPFEVASLIRDVGMKPLQPLDIEALEMR